MCMDIVLGMIIIIDSVHELMINDCVNKYRPEING